MTIQLIVNDAGPALAAGWAFMNSNFMTSLLGSVAGAFGGAWAAQKIANRANKREQLKNEVLLTIRAIEAMRPVCSCYLNMNEQYVRHLQANYEQARKTVLAHFERIGRGEIDPKTILEIGNVDFSTLSPPNINFDRVADLVLDKISASGRPRMVAGLLPQIMRSLEGSIIERNDWIQETKRTGQAKVSLIPAIFGIPNSQGHVDRTYFDLIQHITKQTDDCAYFSRMLINDLMKYGNKARAQFVEQFDEAIPRIPIVDFSEAQRKGLFPAPDAYESWNNKILSRVAQTHGRRLAKLNYMLRRTTRRLARSLWAKQER